MLTEDLGKNQRTVLYSQVRSRTGISVFESREGELTLAHEANRSCFRRGTLNLGSLNLL